MFTNTFFRSFFGFHGLCLLFPVCWMLNYTASPYFSTNPFIWAWNAPTEYCEAKFGIKLDMYLFQLIGSPKLNFPPQDIVIFYIDKLGYYPYIELHTGENVNGGIPQLGCLEKHLEKCKADISYYIASSHHGLGVIDWEEWRPTWLRNWRPKDVYKNDSVDLVLQSNVQLNYNEASQIAKDEFESAGKSFMEETLKLAKLIRPNYLWGYYLFPDCYNHNYNKPGYTGSCPDIEKKRNDGLKWMWEESTALFPSVYLNTRTQHPQAELFVRNRVQEAIRLSKVRDVKNPLPIYVYSRPVFTDRSDKFLSMADLVATAGETIALGATGMIMWGSFNLSRSMQNCINLDNYMKTTLNPYIINVTLASKMCSQVLCQEKGVCIRKHWNSSDYLHLNPQNFVIQGVKGGKYTVLGKPTLQDLQEFSQKFHCSCYPNVNCKTNDNVASVDTINVCIADDVCIEAFMN